MKNKYNAQFIAERTTQGLNHLILPTQNHRNYKAYDYHIDRCLDTKIVLNIDVDEKSLNIYQRHLLQISACICVVKRGRTRMVRDRS